MTTASEKSNLLGNSLRGNAIFSALSGLLLIAAARPLANLIGIQAPLILTVVGVGLFGWVVYLLRVRATHPEYAPGAVWSVITGDLLWVGGSAVLLIGGWLPLTTAGKWIIALIADVVLLFAILQYFGLRRLQG